MSYTRRIPLTDDFLYYRIPDLIYGYIQHKATYNPNTEQLYITADNLRKNKKTLEVLCDCSRRTIDRQIQMLIEAGFIIETTNGKECIYVVSTIGDKWQIIDFDMLEYLLNTRNNNVIKVYAYLLNKYLWKQENGTHYIFTIGELAEMLGYTTKQRDTNKMIENILESLLREGIIKWREVIEGYEVGGKVVPRIRKELLFVAEHKEDLPQLTIERVCVKKVRQNEIPR